MSDVLTPGYADTSAIWRIETPAQRAERLRVMEPDEIDGEIAWLEGDAEVYPWLTLPAVLQEPFGDYLRGMGSFTEEIHDEIAVHIVGEVWRAFGREACEQFDQALERAGVTRDQYSDPEGKGIILLLQAAEAFERSLAAEDSA